MNRARLARRWQEASGDPVRMAEALGDEINDPGARLLSRDFLDTRLAEFEARLTAQTTQLDGRVTTSMAQLEARLLKRLDSHFRWLADVIMAQFGLTMIAVLGLYFR
jgi:hypothetical protein